MALLTLTATGATMRVLIITVIVWISHAPAAAGSSPVKIPTEQDLHLCYEKFPFFLQAIATITDQDFSDHQKSQDRKIEIRTAFDKDPQGIRQCLQNVLDFAQAENDPDEIKFINQRMSEVASVVSMAATWKPGSSRPRRVSP